MCVVALDGPRDRRVLLLHGNPSHLDHFGPLAPTFGPLAGVIAYDHPGFGRSDAFADGRVTLERSVRVAVGVLDALGVDGPVDVLGHSHGGLVAIALAALAPERVRSIMMLGTGAAPAPGGYRVLRAVPGLATLLPIGAPVLAGALTGLVVRRSFAPDAVPAWFVERQIQLLRSRPEVLGWMVRLAYDDPGAKATAYAARVRTPAIVVHGRNDALVGIAHARRLASVLGARFVDVAGGHMVHIAYPERVAPIVTDWLTRAAAPG